MFTHSQSRFAHSTLVIVEYLNLASYWHQDSQWARVTKSESKRGHSQKATCESKHKATDGENKNKPSFDAMTFEETKPL